MRWVSEIAPALPSAWTVTRVSNVADVQFSNVDKHTLDDELPVRLCNYVDVYKNEKITSEVSFMDASATKSEIDRFRILAGDVLVTKDSETPDDIAIPAFVAESLPGVLCGYHLAMIRPRSSRIRGDFLYWLHASKEFRGQYEREAVGVTRFGLSQHSFLAADLPLPPADEQQRIADYLDASCRAIEAAVAAKQGQIDTLRSAMKSSIGRVVTLGLNPKEITTTDVAWIPTMPTDWKLRRIKDVLQFHNTVRVPLSSAERGLMTEKIYDYYGASGVIDKVESFHFDGTYILLAEDGANLLSRSRPLAFLATGKFWVNNHAHILSPRSGGNINYFVELLEAQDFSLSVTGAAQPKLTMENLGRYKIAVPEMREQDAIAEYVQEVRSNFENLAGLIGEQIELLTAYWKSLIHECVTGQRRITDEDVNRVTAHAASHA